MLEPTPTAVLFPGQGSQQPGMRALVARVRPDLLEQVQPLVGADPFERIEESTRFAQPAIFCASLAGWESVRGLLDPIAFAGHALGELTALVAAGALDERDGLRLVALRGELMAASGEEDAVVPFREALAEIEFRTPAAPVYSCATALPFADPREELAAALVRPVRWRETMTALDGDGVQAYVDAGPGRVLAKLAPRCVPGVGAASFEMLLGGDRAAA